MSDLGTTKTRKVSFYFFTERYVVVLKKIKDLQNTC